MKSINSLSDINVSRILRLIWQQKGISRVEIASKLGIDKSTVTKNVATLKEVGIIHEIAEGVTGPQGGRKPIFLEITPRFACVGGVEINPERFVCCLLDLHGSVLFQHQEIITPDVYQKIQCKGVFEKAYKMIADEAERVNVSLVGIGAGLPAMVNSDAGTVIRSLPLMIENEYSLVSDFKDISSVPIYIENDARCCCFSEQMVHDDLSIKNVLFLLTEYRVLQPKEGSKNNLSVGMGLIINGKILKGPEHSAGEFKSLLWTEGKEGQFQAGEDSLERIGYDNDLMHDVFFELAQHVAFLVNTLNLQAVYIGGIEARYAQRLQELIHDRINYQWPYDLPRKFEVKIASLGSLSVAHGAASMFIEQLFALPSLSAPSGDGPSVLEALSNLKNN